jgi:3',5'-cyclic-AMP phosphodiesterase
MARRLLIVSDSHLSPRTPEAAANWAAVARHAVESGADLVVHLGDLTLDGAHVPAELAYARAALDELAVPWVAIPGNHDIGDNPGASRAPEVSAGRLSDWQQAIGPDWWSRDLGGWALIGLNSGLNSQLFGSALPAAAGQWAWLEAQLGALGDRPAVLVSHKPLAASPAELAAAPPYRFVPPADRERLAGLLAGCRVPVVLSGHVHQFRTLSDAGRRHVWVPTCWAVLPEHVQPTFGRKRCGALAVELGDDADAAAELIEPAGLRQLTITVDFPDPYSW